MLLLIIYEMDSEKLSHKSVKSSDHEFSQQEYHGFRSVYLVSLHKQSP